MSQDNVENLRVLLQENFQDIRAFVAELERGDADLSLFDPDVVYEDANLPDHIGESYHGHEGIGRAAERWTEASETLTLELERIVGSGDHLVSIHRAHSRAQYSGIEFDGPLAYAWIFREGKITHFQSFRTEAEALEAAGLSQ